MLLRSQVGETTWGRAKDDRGYVQIQGREHRRTVSLSLPGGAVCVPGVKQALGYPTPTRCEASGTSEAPLSLIFSASLVAAYR